MLRIATATAVAPNTSASGGTIHAKREKPRVGGDASIRVAIRLYEAVHDGVVCCTTTELRPDRLAHGLGDGRVRLVDGLSGALRTHDA